MVSILQFIIIALGSFFFITVECRVQNIINKKKNGHELINAVVDVLKSCPSYRFHTIGLVNPSDDLLFTIYKELTKFNILIFPRSFRRLSRRKIMSIRSKGHKSQVVLDQLHLVIYHDQGIDPDPEIARFILKFTQYRDIQFIILSKFRTCYRKLAWPKDMTVISTIMFICPNNEGVVEFYTTNPFSHRKINRPWMRIIGNTGNFSDLSVLRPGKKHINCSSIFYDKTYTIDKFNIPFNAVSYSSMVEFNMAGLLKNKPQPSGEYIQILFTSESWKLVRGVDGIVMGTLFKFLNATLHMKIYFEGTCAFCDSKSVIEYMAEEHYENNQRTTLQPSTNMMGLNSLDMTMNTKCPMTYPVMQREISIIINKPKIQHDGSRISYNVSIIIYTVIVVIGIFALGCLTRQQFGSAIFIILRLLFRSRIRILINQLLPVRLFLGGFLLFLLVLAAIYQGSQYNVTMVPRALVSFESLLDLNNSGYQIHAAKAHEKYFWYLNSGKYNLKRSQSPHCIEATLGNPRAACIDEVTYLKHSVPKNHHLHILEKPLGRFFIAYPTFKFFALRKRIDILLSRLMESGLVNLWLKQHEDPYYTHRARDMSKMYKPMTLEMCSNAFLILIGGYTISTIVFIIELLVKSTTKFGI